MDFFSSYDLKSVLFTLSVFPISFVLGRVCIFFLQKYSDKNELLPPNLSLRKHLEPILVSIILVLGIESLVPIWITDPTILLYIRNLLSVAFIIIFTWALIRLIHLIKFGLFSHLDINRSDNLRARRFRTQIQFLQKMIVTIIVIIAVALVLMRFEAVRKIGGSIIASAGLAGIVLGFAAQKSLTNFIAGLQIAFTQMIRIDDAVIVENEWGRIEEITFTYVAIRLWDKRSLIVPITYFVEKPFQNWTRTTADLIGVVLIYVDYRMKIDILREEFDKIIRSTKLWDGAIAAVQVTDATKETMEVRFLAGARNGPEAFDLRCIIRERIIKMIQEKYPECLPQVRLNTLDSRQCIA